LLNQCINDSKKNTNMVNEASRGKNPEYMVETTKFVGGFCFESYGSRELSGKNAWLGHKGAASEGMYTQVLCRMIWTY